MKKQLLTSIAIAAMATLSACGGGGGTTQTAAVPPPTAAPPPPPPTGASLAVEPCLSQQVAFGRSLQNILIPDVLTLDLSQPAGFPNGRDLDDPVIDLALAALFLDLRRHAVTTFVGLPVNPNQFDQPLRADFPFYAAPLGSPQLSATNGVNFNFRLDPASNFRRVERAGAPAISTAVVLGNNKNVYNDSNPTVDAAGGNVPLILEGYRGLTNALNDDFKGLGLTPCAT